LRFLVTLKISLRRSLLVMLNIVSKLHELILSGGFVMPPLLVGCAVLWFALSLRYQTLKRGSSLSVRELFMVDGHKVGSNSCFLKHVQDIKETSPKNSVIVLAHAYESFSKGSNLITTIVMISPLLGLLGTVGGMIETFESLGDMSLFSQTGGIAGGISQALISTQMGLAVAIPGLIMGRLLGRKQNALLVDLEQLCEFKNVTLMNDKGEVSHA
jgi:biopolymer transport protein ExbB